MLTFKFKRWYQVNFRTGYINLCLPRRCVRFFSIDPHPCQLLLWLGSIKFCKMMAVRISFWLKFAFQLLSVKQNIEKNMLFYVSHFFISPEDSFLVDILVCWIDFKGLFKSVYIGMFICMHDHICIYPCDHYLLTGVTNFLLKRFLNLVW